MTGPTDDDIEAMYVGDPPIHNDVVQLVEYQSIWPEQFQREAERIQGALGSRALSIDHVGSTSVPGLAAKPIIDIVLRVADSSNEPAYVPDLEAAGYRLRIREPDWYEHRLFKGPEVDVNMHVFSRDCVEVERMIVFRDRLRDNDDDRHLYERTKRELASRRWKYVQHYAERQIRGDHHDPAAQRSLQRPSVRVAPSACALMEGGGAIGPAPTTADPMLRCRSDVVLSCRLRRTFGVWAYRNRSNGSVFRRWKR